MSIRIYEYIEYILTKYFFPVRLSLFHGKDMIFSFYDFVSVLFMLPAWFIQVEIRFNCSTSWLPHPKWFPRCTGSSCHPATKHNRLNKIYVRTKSWHSQEIVDLWICDIYIYLPWTSGTFYWENVIESWRNPVYLDSEGPLLGFSIFWVAQDWVTSWMMVGKKQRFVGQWLNRPCLFVLMPKLES